jgi:hypothetical protein
MSVGQLDIDTLPLVYFLYICSFLFRATVCPSETANVCMSTFAIWLLRGEATAGV